MRELPPSALFGIIPMALFALIVFGIVMVYWLLAWFNPAKLREIETRRVERTIRIFPRARGIKGQLAHINTWWWLWLMRLVPAVMFGAFLLALLAMVSQSQP